MDPANFGEAGEAFFGNVAARDDDFRDGLILENLFQRIQGAEDRAEVEARLRQHWMATLEKNLARPPFQIGLPITFLFFKELELDNLITLITGMLLDLPSEKVAPWLWRQGAGGGHV